MLSNLFKANPVPTAVSTVAITNNAPAAAAAQAGQRLLVGRTQAKVDRIRGEREAAIAQSAASKAAAGELLSEEDANPVALVLAREKMDLDARLVCDLDMALTVAVTKNE